GAVAAVFLFEESALARGYLGLFSIGSVVGLALLFAVYAGKLKFITNRLRHLAWFQALEQDYREICRAKLAWIPLIAMSFVFHITAIVILGLLLLGVGANITMIDAALITAVTGVVGMLPITINGLGVADGSI